MNAVVSTIHGFLEGQGDIVVSATMLCNVEGDIGFVEDELRRDFAWTLRTLVLIIVGDRQ